MSAFSFTKVERGWYATEDGRYAVVVDGFAPVSERDREGVGVSAGITGAEWAAVVDPQGRLRDEHNAGETLDWHDTKRDAVATCNRHAMRDQV